MRKEDIERLKELDAKATPGPWHIDDIRLGDPTLFRVTDNGSFQLGTIHEQVDVELIAEMRNALPQLLAANAALREERDRAIKDRDKAIEALQIIDDTTLGPAILGNICEAGRNEIVAIREFARKALQSLEEIKRIDAELDDDACGAMGSGTT